MQKEEAELRKLEKQQELEEKRRKQEELRNVYAQSIQMKRANEARELQEQLAFDRKILEQLLEESKIEAIEEAQKKVGLSIKVWWLNLQQMQLNIHVFIDVWDFPAIEYR